MYNDLFICPECKNIISNIDFMKCGYCKKDYSYNGIINLTCDDGAADFTSLSDNKYIGFK